MKTLSLIGCCALLTSSLFAQETPRKAPELAFHIPGQGERLLSQYRGKVVAIEFIFTTCPHCQAAAKVNAQFEKDYAARGFQMIDLAINVLENGGTDKTAAPQVINFAQTYGANFPVGYIDRDQMMAFMNFSIMDRMVVPQIVLIDRKGVIRYQTPATSGPDWEKVMNEPALRAHIEELLAEHSGTPEHALHVATSKK